MNHKFIKKRIASIEACGRIVLPPYVCEAMGWEPGMDIIGTKVNGILVLQPAVRPKCCVCQSELRVQKIRNLYICAYCLEHADKSGINKHTLKVWDQGDGYEDECIEEIGEFCDYGYEVENEEDYDSDEFMRN